MTTHSPILPGATIGVFGSGQLGRMLALEARRMGYRVHTFSPQSDTPTGHVADVEVSAPYEDLDAARAFGEKVDVITFEFENVPAATIAAAAENAPCRPRAEVLYVTQNRLREKAFLRDAGFPVTPYAEVTTVTDLHQALEELGSPTVLKTGGFGYDGKGQAKIAGPGEADDAWLALGTNQAVLERFIDFEQEISVVAVRGLDGKCKHYGPVSNRHSRHILDVTIAPADLPEAVANEAVELAHGVLEQLEVVGVMCVEMFVTRDGGLLINELAPRPHNSGHYTVDACVTSQFEQQLRAACGLPLGSTQQHRPAAMANLLGDVWKGGEPNWEAVCRFPEVKLHLYGKHKPRQGRKMGHLTALGDSANDAVKSVTEARKALRTRV